MALVSAGRSSLNPDAPLFIPAYVRQVEDFSPEWWDLVTSAAWFRDYWMSQHQGEDIFGEEEYGFYGSNDVEMLPGNIDIDVDEEILNMEAQFEEFLQSSEFEFGVKAATGVMENGWGKNVDAVMKTVSMRGPKSPRETTKYWEKPAKHVSPKHQGPRFIQQPR